MSEAKILYQDQRIKLEYNGNYYLTDINPCVFIFPYTISEEGYPNKIGVIGDKDLSVISISPSDLDSDVFSTAKRGLKEITGFDITDTDKWDFLGTVKIFNGLSKGFPSFSIDITGSVAELESENNISDKHFNLVTAMQALECDNSTIHCLFLKTFQSKILNPNTIKNYDAI